MPYEILAINPGSTSTKIAWFQDDKLVWKENVEHDVQQLKAFHNIAAQFEFRAEQVKKAVATHGSDIRQLSAVVGRGGLLRPIPSGVYRINELMLEDLMSAKYGEHASNLGAPISNAIAKEVGCPAFIVDPVVVDEMEDVARITGWPEFRRKSIFHALNQKAVARRVARDVFGKRYDELNFIVVHLGGGITIGAHKRGRVVDVNNGLSAEGPMTPERAGTLYLMKLADYLYEHRPDKKSFYKKLIGGGGWVAHLGTNSGREVEERIKQGDEKALLIVKATAYQISKWVAHMAVALQGQVDAIVITGGLAYMPELVEFIKERVLWIAPVLVVPGEDEMLALAEGALRALRGEEEPKEY
ncbi:butyrate kinase [Coprothermobacteraceae bacterium]|nr:butyrate kinase [Coprothermobacteraceae bacterium]